MEDFYEIKRAYHQGLEKLVNQKMPPSLTSEGPSINAAYTSIRTWAAYFTSDEGSNEKTLKELMEKCWDIVTQLERCKKDVKKL